MKLRKVILTGIIVIGVAFGSLPLRAQTKGPIKIGFIVPLSGGYAQNGRDILNGFQLYLEQIGYQAAGRRIQLLVEDSEAIPAVALTKTRKLVEKDQVHMMAGPLLTSYLFSVSCSMKSTRSGVSLCKTP